jgi:hypothetical protein
MTQKMLDSFLAEINEHPHREELIELMIAQVDDMNSVKYLELNAERI